MSVGALVSRVGQVLGLGHALFAGPHVDGGGAASPSGSQLSTAGDAVRTGQQRIRGLSGALAVGYTRFATDAGAGLNSAADTDTDLSHTVRDSAAASRFGWRDSASALDGAASDTAALAPATASPAGQRALISALRARLSQQQHVIGAYQTRDARLAAMVRELAYSRRTAGAVMPLGDQAFRGGTGVSGAGGGLSLPPPATFAGRRTGPAPDRRTMLASRVDSRRDRAIPSEPGEGAAKAALSKLGRPYVWGAKGPNVFDCSGLTQWAWGQAGVRLGGDTYTQIGEGLPVPAGQVRAGDLIFPLESFGKGGRSGPGHVQMAISSTQVVHAPQTGDVVRVVPMPGRYIARRPVRDAAL